MSARTKGWRLQLDVDTLVVAMQGSDPTEFKLGHDLRIPAARILARLTGDLDRAQDRHDAEQLVIGLVRRLFETPSEQDGLFRDRLNDLAVALWELDNATAPEPVTA